MVVVIVVLRTLREESRELKETVFERLRGVNAKLVLIAEEALRGATYGT